MQILHVLSALPAAGKTTKALAMVAASKNRMKRVNLDDLRAMVDGGKWTPKNEDLIKGIHDGMILGFLERGFDVVTDNTHLAAKYADYYEKLVAAAPSLKGKDVEVVHEFIDVPMEECVRRDALRGDKSVGRKVIHGMWTDHLWTPPAQPPFDPALQDAVIFDIDGTLALMGRRSPYAHDKVHLDIVNTPVREALNAHKRDGKVIIIVSGRKAVCREATEKWLADNYVKYDLLFMRKSNDDRADDIVKKEIYDEAIKGGFNVRLVYDDRDRVVRMWRSIGLVCVQVAYGDF